MTDLAAEDQAIQEQWDQWVSRLTSPSPEELAAPVKPHPSPPRRSLGERIMCSPSRGELLRPREPAVGPAALAVLVLFMLVTALAVVTIGAQILAAR